MSNREKFKDNSLSAVCTTIFFNGPKDKNKLYKITSQIPVDELMHDESMYTASDSTAAYKFYKIPNNIYGKKDIQGNIYTQEFIYFEIYGIKDNREDPINWVLNIGSGESIVDENDVYLLEMELLSWLLYEGYSIP
jgi:hypothetical protein